MNRPSTAVFAVLEALLVVGIGVGVPVAVLSLLWGVQYGLQIDWLVFWRAAVDVWLVGHGVDLTLVLSPEAAAATGLPGAEDPVGVTITALGVAVLTVVLGARAGRAIAETPHRLTGVLTAVGAVAVLSTLLTLSARHPSAEPSLVQGILLPTLVYAVPLVASAEVARRRRGAAPDVVTETVLQTVGRLPEVARRVTGVALRVALGSVAGLLAVSAVAVAVLLVTSYADVIALYEAAHAGYLGGLALTLGQLALLPVLVLWAASWFVGPGFALGTGSDVSPLGTTVGPLPGVPVLGALPTQDWSFAFVGILVPVVAAFVTATLLRPRVLTALGQHVGPVARALVGVGAGAVGGLVVGLLAATAAGSVGPGRLAEVGPAPVVVGAIAALEFAVAAALALLVDGRAFLGGGDDDGAASARDGDRDRDRDRGRDDRDGDRLDRDRGPVGGGRSTWSSTDAASAVVDDAATAGGRSRPRPAGRLAELRAAAARRVAGLRPAGDADEAAPTDLRSQGSVTGSDASAEATPVTLAPASATPAPATRPAPAPEPHRPRIRLDRASERAALADAATDEIPVVGGAAASAGVGTGAGAVPSGRDEDDARGGADAGRDSGRSARRPARGDDGEDTERIEGLER